MLKAECYKFASMPHELAWFLARRLICSSQRISKAGTVFIRFHIILRRKTRTTVSVSATCTCPTYGYRVVEIDFAYLSTVAGSSFGTCRTGAAVAY